MKAHRSAPLSLVLALVLFVAPTGGLAQAPAAPAKPMAGPPPPAPAFEMGPFRFLVGRWKGEGVFGFNGKPLSSVMSFQPVNRTTLMVRAAEDAPNTYAYVGLWSLEKESGALLMLMSSSLDGPALYQSGGWREGRLVFAPKAGVNTGPSQVRFTYVKESDRQFQLTYEFSVNGQWLLGDRQTFTKAD